MKRLLLSIALFLPCLLSNGQRTHEPLIFTPEVGASTGLGEQFARMTFEQQVDLVKDLREDNYQQYFEGSPYFNDEWALATVIMTNGREKEYEMRYLLWDDSFLIKKEDETQEPDVLVMTNQVKQVNIGDHAFIATNYIAGSNTRQAIMEVIDPGKYNLLKRHFLQEKKGQSGAAYKAEKKPEIQKKAKLYYKARSFAARELPTKKKDFFAIFGDKASEIERYAKEQKLKLNEEGYVKIFEYFNSL